MRCLRSDIHTINSNTETKHAEPLFHVRRQRNDCVCKSIRVIHKGMNTVHLIRVMERIVLLRVVLNTNVYLSECTGVGDDGVHKMYSQSYTHICPKYLISLAYLLHTVQHDGLLLNGCI